MRIYLIVNLTKGENIINVVFWKQLASDEFVDIFYLIIAPDISELLNDDSRWSPFFLGQDKRSYLLSQ